MVSDKSVQKCVLRIKLELSHLTAESVEEEVGDGAVQIHEQDNHPCSILIVYERCQRQFVETGEVPCFRRNHTLLDSFSLRVHVE